MRLLMFFILLLAFGCQQTTVNGQQTLCTVPEPVEGTASGASTSSATAYPMTVDCCPLSVDYYEKQIHIADSLYKNYLPQYNFEEVKAAVEFFDSVQLSAISRQRWRLFNKKADNEKRLIAESRLLTAAKAHYYHAVGLTERDDIVGACEHYLTALEIMEFETENLKTSKSESILTNGKRLKSKGKEKEKAHGSQLIAHSSKKSVDRCLLTVDNPEDYEKIRFLALIYSRLGELYHNEGCTSMAKDAYKKCINIYMSLNDSIAFANYYKQLGDIYIIEDNYDSSLFFYNKSIESLDNANNPITRDSWKGISAVLHHNGDVDSSYKIIKELVSVADGDEQYAYKTKLAQMYYKDEVYDSALIYFEEVLKRDNKYTKISAANYISKIYAAKGDAENSNYFLNLYSDELIEEFNRTSHKSQIMKLYNDYMYKRPLSHETGKSNFLLILLMIMVLCLFSFMILLNYGRKKHIDNSHKTQVKTFNDCIDEFKNENIYTKISSVKDTYIKSAETNRYKEFQLNNDDKEILINSVNRCFNGYAIRLVQLYPNLNTNDVMYCCLILLGMENKEIGALMGVQYQSVKDRLRKLSTIFNTDELNTFVKNRCDEFLSH